VTEFCTYGSLFDFLHSMDWMVTDERLSASVQSWTTDREKDRDSQTGAVGSSQNNSIGSAAQSLASTTGTISLPGTMGLQSSSSVPASPMLMHPSMASADLPVNNYPKFTKLTTPPPSPAPSPAIAANPKRVPSAGPNMVQQLFQRNPNANRSDPDLEKGANELSGLGNSSGKGSSHSESKDSSSDVASRLADALNGQFLPENALKPMSGGSERSSFNSHRTVRLVGFTTVHNSGILTRV
jgi:hypothetical protein